jgi:succinyl-CoA synthetase alpha subunit
MGHAGAIITGGSGSAREKIEKLSSCGIRIAENPAIIGQTVVKVLKTGKEKVKV